MARGIYANLCCGYHFSSPIRRTRVTILRMGEHGGPLRRLAQAAVVAMPRSRSRTRGVIGSRSEYRIAITREMSTVRAKADVRWSARDFAFWSQLGHQLAILLAARLLITRADETMGKELSVGNCRCEVTAARHRRRRCENGRTVRRRCGQRCIPANVASSSFGRPNPTVRERCVP